MAGPRKKATKAVRAQPPERSRAAWAAFITPLLTFARREWWLVLFAAVFLGLTWLTWTQPLHPAVDRPPLEPWSTRWWLSPLEWDAPGRVARTSQPVTRVHPIAGTNVVWASGPGGLVLRSEDRGVTWSNRSVPEALLTAPQETNNSGSQPPESLPESAPESAPIESPPQDQKFDPRMQSVPNAPMPSDDLLEKAAPRSKAMRRGLLDAEDWSRGAGEEPPSFRVLPAAYRPTLAQQPSNPSRQAAPPSPPASAPTTTDLGPGTPIGLISLDQPFASFPNAHVAFVGVPEPEGFRLLRSLDAGRTWRRVERAGSAEDRRDRGADFYGESVHFLSASHGFAATSAGLASTVDTGAMWQLHDMTSMRPMFEKSISGALHTYLGIETADQIVSLWISLSQRGSIQIEQRVTPIWRSSFFEPWNIRYLEQGTAWNFGEAPRPLDGRMVDSEFIAVTTDGGRQWSDIWSRPLYQDTNNSNRLGPPLSIRDAAYRFDERDCVAIFGGGEVWHLPRGDSWRRVGGDLRLDLVQLTPWSSFIGLSPEGELFVSDDGVAWHRTVRRVNSGDDAGGPPPTRWWLRLPAPWWFVALVVLGFMSLALVQAPPPQAALEADDSVANVGVSDRPLTSAAQDRLGLARLARSISMFFRHEKTEGPLVVAVTGPWGSGKSSLMNLIREDLRKNAFTSVWFNAWHNQSELDQLGTLMENAIRRSAPPPMHRPNGIRFRARLYRRRVVGGFRQHPIMMTIMVGLGVFSIGFLAGKLIGLAAPAPAPIVATAAPSPFAFRAQPDAPVEDNADESGGEQATQQAMTDPILGPIVQAAQSVLGSNAKLSTIFTALVTAIIALFTAVRPTFAALSAFGAPPGKLLGSILGISRSSGEPQRSIGPRFASDFEQVTWALGPRYKLVIFIDDLDRCNEEVVNEVLSAVNLLASNGPCIIVLGMDIDYVRTCIQLRYKDQIEELPNGVAHAADGTSGASGGAARSAPVRDFAMHFLEKLVNIEVPVPMPAPADSIGVIRDPVSTAEPAGSPRAGKPRWRSVLEPLPGVASRVIVASLILSFAAGVGWWGWDYGERGAAAVRGATPASTPSETAQTSTPPASPEDGQSSSDAPKTRGIPDPDASVPARVLIASSSPIGLWIALVGGSGLLLAALLAAAARPTDRIVADSDDFAQALARWHPFVAKVSTTPRALKRHVNRLRYLALRQRADEPPQTWLDRLESFVRELLRKPPSAASSDEPATNANEIPSELLVALGAIHAVEPAWLSDKSFADDPEGFLRERLAQEQHDMPAGALHREDSTNFPPITPHLEQFNRLIHGIRIR